MQVKVKQGVKSSINNNSGVLNAGTLAVTTDTNELFVTHNDGTVHQLCDNVKKAGDTMSGDLDMGGNELKKVAIEVVTSLPTTDVVGRQVTYKGRTYIWDGSAWKCDSDYLEIGGRNYIRKFNSWYRLGGFIYDSSDESLNISNTINYYNHSESNNIYLLDNTTYTLSLEVPIINGDCMIELQSRPDAVGANTVVKTLLHSGISEFTFNSGVLPVGFTHYTLRLFGISETSPITVKIRNIKLEKGNIATDWTPAPEDKADVDHNHDDIYLGIDAKAADSDLLDGKHASDFAISTHNHEGIYLKPADVVDNLNDSSIAKPLSANQGKILGGLITERLKGVKVDGVELIPDANKVVSIPTMVGATASTNGAVGLVPKPLSGQQAAFLRGDGTYGVPNADIVNVATYIDLDSPKNVGATFSNNGSNVLVTLSNTYVSSNLFPGAVDIVRILYNGSELAIDEDFTINANGGNAITINGFQLDEEDIILIKYKTSIGVYGSIFQTSVENCITVTSDANTAALRAENAAIAAESIADTKIDKTSITDELGTDKTKVMSQYGVSDAIMKSYDYDINTLSYGVKLDLNGTGQTLTRVGNLSLHKSLPIQNKMRGCLLNDDGSVNYYLSDDSDLLKEDGITPSVLDGTDGNVMTEIPAFYVLENDMVGFGYSYISEFPLPGFNYIPKMYVARYESVINRSTGKVMSIINTSTTYRGGANTSAWDGTYRSLLGRPATNQSRTTYRNGARLNRSVNWNIQTTLSDYVVELLFRIEYATYDSQATFNSALTVDGYKQGGLGVGVTEVWDWGNFNGYNPFIPCGYTADLGNKTGVKDFVMPAEYGTLTTQVNRYRGIELPFGHIWKHRDGFVIEMTESYTIAKYYIYDDPANFADTKTANARYLCDMPVADGWIKRFNKYTTIPYSIGCASNAWGFDYAYIKNDPVGTLRGVLSGGAANAGSGAGSGAGFGCSSANNSHATAFVLIGFRLCYTTENIIINVN